MTLDNGILLQLLANGKEVIFPEDKISFSISDSIHSLYSRMSVSMEDKNAKFSEFLVTTPGNVMEIKYGYEENLNSLVEGKFVIIQDRLEETDGQTPVMGGMVDLGLYHEWFNFQEEGSRSFRNSVSNVVNSLTGRYPFKKKNIESARNSNSWFQGMRTPAKFITEVLTPNAWSSEAQNTPFFAYIDNHNTFNFRSYHSMSNKIETEYVFNPKGMSNDNELENIILGISRGGASLLDIKQTEVLDYYYVNDSGEVKLTRLETDEFPRRSPSQSYVVANKKGLPVKHHLRFYSDVPTDDKQASKANLMRSSLFRDRFTLLIHFNPSIVCGKSLGLKIFMPTSTNGNFSGRFSGDYVIESSEHIWDGPGKNAMTRLVVSRKYATIPDTYLLKGLLQ